MAIAVKKLNQENFQGRKEWLGEINYLGKLQHPNLVKLIGYCYEDNHRLLVFEFISRGSMENHLFMRGPLFQPLSWDLRMKIALGAAKGLAFLHSADVNVIYGGFKTSNILLDSNYNAKLSNFYLARDGLPDDESYVSTPVVGTNSYVAQGYFSTGHLMAKSDDVYSLGVVLLEILFGRRAIDVSQPSKQRDLVKWAKRYYWTNKLSVFYILDPCFDRWRLFRRAEKLANLALHCLNDEPKFRPEMDDVVMVLEGLQ
ncbi:probable serine/threonine-protein kinase PBL11 isoform X2 [Jatropha curcas]|nr:probable serine/threonine-protein kinase PBL11 isoform X2 [Jatropha curcas]